jgi:RNA polymerase sigma factor (sigma-70 family)
MKSYNIQIKVRNNYLLSAMRERGIKTAAELSRLTDIPQQVIGKILSLKIPMYARNTGLVRKPVATIAGLFGVDPEDLYPPEHRENPLQKNIGEAEVSFQEIQQITAANSIDRVENGFTISTLINKSTLTDREKKVISLRFFEGQTFDEVGEAIGPVSRERVRQIESKALRKLRTAAAKNHIRPYADGVNE